MVHRVTSQVELDKLLQQGKHNFEIIGFVAVLRGSSHAVLWGSSHAELRGYSHAVLWDSSHAELWDSSHAVLWGFSAVHIKSKNAKAQAKSGKAAKINVSYPKDIKGWCLLQGIQIRKQRIQLWKCVDSDGFDFYSHTINYDTHKEILCPDWNSSSQGECGEGLHLADSPISAILFVPWDKRNEARLFKVSANINDCKCFPGLPLYPEKIRAKKCRKIKEYPIKDFI